MILHQQRLVRKEFYGDCCWTAPANVKTVRVIPVVSNDSIVSAGVSASYLSSLNDIAYSWGRNDFSQLGNNSDTPACVPTEISCGIKFKKIAAGYFHTAGISEVGDLYLWGRNDSGQLGTADIDGRCVPTLVCSGKKWIDVAVGGSSTIAVDDNRDVWSAGYNGGGNLGNCAIDDSCVFVPACGGIKFKSVSASSGSSFGVSVDGYVYAWGFDTYGELGTGTHGTTALCVPTRNCLSVKVKQLAPNGNSNHVLALAETGDAYAWGRNNAAQLGIGCVSCECIPKIVGTTRFRCLAAGQCHSLGIAPNGFVYAWGTNACGRTGLNITAGFTCSPTVICCGFRYKAISAGTFHSVGVLDCGVTVSWGANLNGSVGVCNSASQNYCQPAFVCCNLMSININDFYDSIFSVVAGTQYEIKLNGGITKFNKNILSSSRRITGVVLEYWS